MTGPFVLAYLKLDQVLLFQPAEHLLSLLKLYLRKHASFSVCVSVYVILQPARSLQISLQAN